MEKLQSIPNLLIDSISLVNNMKYIGENGTKSLGEKISKCVSVTSLNLDLRGNSISEKGAKFLGEGIS